ATIGRSRPSSPARSASSPSGISLAPRMWPSGPSNSPGSRTSRICTASACSSRPSGSISQMPAKVYLSGAQSGSSAAAGSVAGRVEKTRIRQAENLLAHRAVHRSGIALLEIGPAAAPDEQAIAGKCHAAVVEHIGEAAAGVAGGGADLKIALAEGDDVVGHQ